MRLSTITGKALFQCRWERTARYTDTANVLRDPALSSAQRYKWASRGIRAQMTAPWRKEDRLLGLITGDFEVFARSTPRRMAILEGGHLCRSGPGRACAMHSKSPDQVV